MAEAGVKAVLVDELDLIGRFLCEDFVNMTTGEIYAEAGEEITEDILATLRDNGVDEVGVLFIDNVNFGPHLRNTLAADRNNSREEALVDIYRVMRPSEPLHWKAHTRFSKPVFQF